MLYEHDPQLLHLRDNWNTTPIMRSIDQVRTRSLLHHRVRTRSLSFCPRRLLVMVMLHHIRCCCALHHHMHDVWQVCMPDG